MQSPFSDRSAIAAWHRAALIGCTACLVACAGSPDTPRKTNLARLPAAVGPIAIADDATSHAYVDESSEPARVIHDGAPGPTFPGFGPLVFAPVTRRLFYWAGAYEGPGYLIADGRPIGDFGKDGVLVFARDGTRWSTAPGTREVQSGSGSVPGAVVVLADGAELGRHPDASTPTFSPDGRHLAYLADGGDGTTRLLVDGRERARWPVPTAPCAARRKRELRGPTFWPQFQVKYLSDGSLVTMTQDQDGWGIYRDGHRLASYPASLVQSRPWMLDSCKEATAIAAWSFVAAERGPVVAWWERLEGAEERWRVVVDAKPVDDVVCSRPWLHQPPELTPDGRQVAYACQVEHPEARVFLVAGGRRYGPYTEMWAYAWSDDGGTVAYGAAEHYPAQEWRYYVDGARRSRALSAVWRPRLEPGTGRLAWQGELTPGGTKILGIDGRRIASFDDVIFGPAFLRPQTVTWVIRRGRWLTRIDAPTA